MPTSIDNATLADVVRKHLSALPQSAITRLGAGFTKAFYRFAESSPLEALFIEADSTGVTGACIVSLQSETLQQRLTRSPRIVGRLTLAVGPFLFMLPTIIHDIFNAEAPIRGAEVVILFTSENAQRRGIASKLIARSETYLREQGATDYAVRTDDEPGGAAIAFYERHGFEKETKMAAQGRALVVLRKSLTVPRENNCRPPSR